MAEVCVDAELSTIIYVSFSGRRQEQNEDQQSKVRSSDPDRSRESVEDGLMDIRLICTQLKGVVL